MNRKPPAPLSSLGLLLGLALALPALAQAPVSDVSTSQRRMPASNGVVVEEEGGYSNGSARTYGAAGDSDEQAVEDLPRSTPTSSSGNSSGGSEAGTLYRQLQQLQEQVANLQGQLEEQAHEIKKLKQQHQDDFAALDQRLAGGGASAAAASTTTSNINGKPAPAAANTDGQEEYEAAYGKLKSKDYAGATSAFKAFVSKYPNSDFAGNAWFWLGFVYQTQGDFDNAARSFEALLERFPHHNKADDGKYNLGKLYHQQGKTEQATALLKEAAAGNSKSAPLAKSYLETM